MNQPFPHCNRDDWDEYGLKFLSPCQIKTLCHDWTLPCQMTGDHLIRMMKSRLSNMVDLHISKSLKHNIKTLICNIYTFTFYVQQKRKQIVTSVEFIPRYKSSDL